MILASPSAIKLREYERIFTGTNQDVGYGNPILNFVGDTTLQVFPTDKTTYFHYPITAPSGLLIDSELVNCGAIAGIIPYYSDKIWKKMANYKSFSIWGNSQPVGKQTGVWLCSWLSGDQTVLSGVSGYIDPLTPVWKDRWYNPGYIDPISAMYVATAPSAVILDIDSEMSFEGGSYYKYYHMGSVKNDLIVTSLSGLNDLKLHIDNWEENIKDLSFFNNTVVMSNYSSDMVSHNGINPRERPQDTCLLLNGTNQDCQVLHSSSYAVSSDMTYSIWAHAADWSNVQGNHLLSKDHRGGWSLKYDNGFFTPILTVFDRNNGNMVFLNSTGSVLASNTLPGSSHPVASVIDDNMFTWVLDNGVYQGYKHLYKMDYKGDIRGFVSFLSTENLKCVSIDNYGYNNPAITANNLVWVLATSSHSAFDSFTLDVINSLSGISPISANYCDIDLQSQYQESGLSFCFDNNGNRVSSSGTIACDKDGYMWVLSGANDFYKYDASLTTLLLSGVVGDSTVLSGRNIDFTNEFVEGEYRDYVWFLQEAENIVYKYNTSGHLITRVNLSPYNINAYSLGDFTGYQRHRKFNYLRYNSIPQVKAEVFLNTTPYYGKKYVLSTPTSAMSNNDWHMFTFTCDAAASTTISMYMDSVIRDSIIINYPNYIYYEYENPLGIGVNIGKLGALDTELDIKQTHFNGKLDDLRIYDVSLNNSDIRYIYLNKFDYKALNWNMPTGDQSYLEEIERFFKFKLPGLKSQYYNIRLIGLQITDIDTRTLIENIIKNTIKKLTPAYAELFKIIWE